MDNQPTTSPKTEAPATKRKEPTYDGQTFCDLAGCPDSTRLLVKKKFPGEEKTAAQWTAALAEAGVKAVAIK